MATYGPMVITTLGQQALAEAQAGETLTFTRFQIGSGQLSTTLTSALTQGIAYTSLALASTPRQINSGDTIIIGSGPTTQTVTASAPANAGSTSVSVNSFTASANFSANTIVTDITDAQGLTACVTPIDYFDVQTEYVNGNTANVMGIYSNTNLTGSTYTCEVGLYASTTTTGEVLYAYSNAGTLGDTMPPYSSGPFSRQFQISTAVSNVASVTANVPSTVYIAETEKGAANGVTTLDANAHITVSQYGNIPAANLTGGPIPSAVLPPANSATLGTVETAQNAASGNPIAVITNPASQAGQSINGGLTVTDVAVSGMTGAQTASRYVGAVSGAAPTTGTFDVGDWAIDVTNLTFWICAVAGSPGTWANLNYLRTDSGAPNPQTVANPVAFSSNISVLGNVGSELSGTSEATQVQIGVAGSGGGTPRIQLYANGSNNGNIEIDNYGNGTLRIYQPSKTPALEVDASSGNITAAGSITSSSGTLGSASGTWTPASGSLNVAAGTVINVAGVPSGAKFFDTVDTTGQINGAPNVGEFQMSGIMQSSGASGQYSYNNGSNPSVWSASGISSTTTSGSLTTVCDGTYYASGYYQLNGGYLQFVVTTTDNISNNVSTVKWGVA